MNHTTHKYDAIEEHNSLIYSYLPLIFVCTQEGILHYYTPPTAKLFNQKPLLQTSSLSDLFSPQIAASFLHEIQNFDSTITTNHFLLEIFPGQTYNIVIQPHKTDQEVTQFYTIQLKKISNKDKSLFLGKPAVPSNEQQLKYQAVVDNTLDGIFLSDLVKGRAVECNRQACNLFGASRAELLEGGVLGFSPEIQPDGQTSKNKLKEIKEELLGKGSGSKKFQWRYRKKTGKEFDADVVVNLIDEDNCKLWLTMIRDVSERVNNERALKESYLKLQGIFNNTFHFTWLLNQEGTLQEINETALNIFDEQLDNLIGQKIWNTTWWKQNPLSTQELQSSINQVLKTRKTIRFSSSFYDNEKEKHILDFSLKPLMNEENKILHLILEGRDVTELVKSKEDTINRERLYRSIIRNTQGTTVILFNNSLDIELVEGSYMEMFNLQEQAILDMKINILCSSSWGTHDAQKEEEKFIEALQGQLVIFERLCNGRNYYIKVVPIRDFGGEIKTAMVIIQDVTDIRKAELALSHKVTELHEKNEELETMIDKSLYLEQFAYMASHDLKEPLRTISGFAQLVKRSYYDKLDQIGKEYLDFIIDGAKRMDALISALLNYSKINSDEIYFEDVNIHNVFTIASNNLMKSIVENKVSINIDSDMPEIITGNRDRLVQLFQNLIANSIKFRNDEGQEQPIIHIKAEAQDQHWHFSLADNGIGIEPENQEKIFLLFKKVHSKKHRGSGIGLATCSRIVEQHKGKIWVESEPGQGATFHFTVAKNLQKPQ